MSGLYILLILLGVVLALSLLSGWSRDLRESVEAERETLKNFIPAPASRAAAVPVMKRKSEIGPPAPEETAGHWWRQVFRPLALLGALLLPLQAVVLVGNTHIVAQTLSIVLDQVPEPLFIFKLLGWSREVSMHDLYALLIALGQFVFAATAGHGILTGKSPRWLTLAALAGWVVLGGYEVGASAYRGYLVEGNLSAAALSAALALGLVLMEAVCGVLILDLFVLPLLAAVAWSCIALLRLLRRGWTAATDRAVSHEAEPQRPPRPPRVSAWRAAMSSLDAILMEPLRELDRIVYEPSIVKLRAWTSRTSQTGAAVSLALVAVLLTGCQIEKAETRRAVTWYLVPDLTGSVPPAQFTQYKTMMARFVLGHLRPRDEMFLVPLGGDLNESVAYQSMDRGRMTHAALAFFDQHVRDMTRNPAARGTDFGGVLKFIARSVEERLVTKAGGRVVAIVLTDGWPTGRQTMPASFPAGVRVWFVGVQPQHEPALRQLCSRAGLDGSQAQIVLFGGWQSWVKLFAHELNRETNWDVLRKISFEVSK